MYSEIKLILYYKNELSTMRPITVNQNIIVATKGLHIDCYDRENHRIISINSANSQKDDKISDIVVSSDNKYLAVLTSVSKQIIIYSLPTLKEERVFLLPRSASKIRFTVDNTHILVADKTGDGLIYNILEEDRGTKILGHLSILLDILQTSDGKYIITSDRDEKIRVTCYPNTYSIHTYCFGHKEFVNNLELLAHNNKYVLSTSGDGTIKCWDYEKGTLCYTIDTHLDVNDENIKIEFKKSMDSEGLEVERLPIVHCTIVRTSASSSTIAITVHLVKKIFIYNIYTENSQFNHKLINMFDLDEFPSAIQLNDSLLFVYFEANCEIVTYEISENDQINANCVKKIQFFQTVSISSDIITNTQDAIKVLYKRKTDNVQEYLERKKLRLGTLN